MTGDPELAHADAVLGHAARTLEVANARARTARLEADRAGQQAGVAYHAWAQASSHRDRLIAARRAAAAIPGGEGPVARGPVGAPVRAEASAWSVQTVLLALGGVLLSVAAIVFTVVAWGAFGIGGRAAILAGITAITFAVPAVLHRRGLASTAETIGLLGLVLLALDGYALRHVGLVPAGVDAAGYAGLVLGATAAVALGYPLLVPLRTLRPAGLVLAHPAAVLSLVPLTDAVAAYAALGLALAAGDLTVRWYVRGAALRVAAAVCGGVTALVATLCALTAASAPAGAQAAAAQRVVGTLVLLGLALAAPVAAETVRASRSAARGLAAGVAVPLALSGPVLQWLRYGPDGWGLTGVAVALIGPAAVTLALRTPWRTGAGVASAVLAVAAAAPPVAAVGFALLAPLAGPDLFWGATSATQPVWVMPDARPSPDLVGALLGVTVVAALLLVALGGDVARQAARNAAPLGVGAVVVLAPAAAGAPIWATVLLVGVAALVATAAGHRLPGGPAGGSVLLWLGGALAVHAVVVALASREATLVTLGLVALGYGALAARSTGVRQAVATGVALGALGGWAAAAATALVTGSAGWAGGPGPAGAGVGLTALTALAVARLTRHARPASAAVAAIFAGVAVHVAAALAAVLPTSAGFPRLVDRPVVAVLALAAAVLAAAAVLTVAAVRTVAPRPDPSAPRPDPSTALPDQSTAGPAGTAWAAGAAAAPGLLVAGLALLPTVLAVVFGPLAWVTAVWTGAPADAARLGPALTHPGTPLDALVLLEAGAVLLGAGAVLLGAEGRTTRRAVAWFAAPVLAPGAIAVSPAVHAPWPVALTVLLALAALGAAAAARAPRVAVRAVNGVLATVTSVVALAWALADRTATLLVLGVVLAGAAAVTVLSRDAAPRRAGAAAVAASAVGLAFASGAAAGVPTAYLLVAVATALVLPGVVAAPRVVGDVLDAGAAVAGALALAVGGASMPGTALPTALDAAGRPVFALTTTLLGVPLGLAGSRTARRWCAWLVPAVELLALWAWLGRAGVTVPEAYTLPAAALAAVFGLATLRRRPAVSSWLALGPALAVAAVPTGALALSDGTLGPRVLLLGVAALVVTLAGAATRRQAPFLFGACVLTLVTARALAPVLPALAEAVPTWVPLSLAGALLLAVGATYERRRRDATRLAGFVRHMR